LLFCLPYTTCHFIPSLLSLLQWKWWQYDPSVRTCLQNHVFHPRSLHLYCWPLWEPKTLGPSAAEMLKSLNTFYMEKWTSRVAFNASG
jgi:hypothetical protein